MCPSLERIAGVPADIRTECERSVNEFLYRPSSRIAAEIVYERGKKKKKKKKKKIFVGVPSPQLV
jgi:hypothetical protein